MTNIMLKQFKPQIKHPFRHHYVRTFGSKSSTFLDTIIPNLSENLKKSTQLFIEAAFNQDKNFIEATAARFLKNALFKDYQNMKWDRISVKRIHLGAQSSITKKQAAKAIKFKISPYVILGLPIKKRLQRTKEPWEDIYFFLSPSRYLHLDITQQLQDIAQAIGKDHIYGFNCYYTNPNFSYQTTIQGAVTNHPPREMMVSFETDSVNHQFYVADFNYTFTY